MEPIHPMSSVAALPELELWSVPSTQISIAGYREHHVYPLSIVDSNSPIVFNVNSSVDEYLKPDSLSLYMEFSVSLEKQDKTDLTENDWKSLKIANYGLHSMFKQVEMEVNGVATSPFTQNYAERAYLEAKLGMSVDAKKSFLTASLWSEDEDVRSSCLYPTDYKSKEGRQVCVQGKLHTDLSFQPKCLIGNTQIKLTLIQNKPVFFLKYKAGLHASISIHNIYLAVLKMKVAPIVVDAHRKALTISPAKYPITQTVVKKIVVPKGLLDVTVDNIVHGQIPRRMFIAFVDNRASNGSQEHDPFEFNHYNVNYVSVTHDGTQYPAIAFTPNFKEKKYAREFIALYESLGQDRTDSYLNISYENFANKNVIFGFNFASDLSNGAGFMGHLSPLVKGSLRLQLRFSSALPDPINIIAFCEFDNIFEISNEGLITTSLNGNV